VQGLAESAGGGSGVALAALIGEGVFEDVLMAKWLHYDLYHNMPINKKSQNFQFIGLSLTHRDRKERGKIRETCRSFFLHFIEINKLSSDITQHAGPDLESGRELPVCFLRGRGLTQGQALQKTGFRVTSVNLKLSS
jgi:hypothetical protein